MPRRTTQLLLLAGLAGVLLAGCGGGSGSKTSTPSHRTAAMESIFENQGQLLSDPVRTLTVLRRLGVDRVRVFVPWASLAPAPRSRVRPAGFDATSPAAYPARAWDRYDAIVRAGVATGVGVFLTLEGPAPLWAAASDVPAGTNPALDGYWKPSPAEYGQFVRAVGTRYSGSFAPAPGAPTLPRVSFWSIWNEPNYGQQLAPQAIDHSTVEVSPALYRTMLASAWSALHATGHGSDTILIGELAPRGITTGDNPGNFSGMVPLRFVRALYCVDGSLHQLRGAAAAARGCPTTASGSDSFVKDNPGLFSASGVAVHPYPQGGVPPNVATPLEPDYADLAALPRLESTLDRAVSAYGSSKRFQIYSTEFGYQTNPPEKIARAINPVLASVYLNWAEYLSWRDPRIASWNQYQLPDPRKGNFATGLLFADGTPKALYYAYRMPVFMPVRTASRGQALELWGEVRPARYAQSVTHRPQSVAIEFRARGTQTFKVLRRITLTDPHGYFDTRIVVPSTGIVRLGWTYPDGTAIHSRIVKVTIR